MQVDPDSRNDEFQGLVDAISRTCELAQAHPGHFRAAAMHLGRRQAAAAALVCSLYHVPLLRLIDWHLSGPPAQASRLLGVPQRQVPRELQLAPGEVTLGACRRLAAAAKGCYAAGNALAALCLWRGAFQQLQAWQAGPERQRSVLNCCAANIGIGRQQVCP